jgi:hypothetical protein
MKDAGLNKNPEPGSLPVPGFLFSIPDSLFWVPDTVFLPGLYFTSLKWPYSQESNISQT